MLNTHQSLGRDLTYHQSVQQRLPSKFLSPIMFAHRGAMAHAPQNTLESFQLAIRLGATGLETDAWITRDGQVVLDHDGVLKTRFRRSPISGVLRIELPTSIPTLDELIEICGQNTQYSIDVCDPGAINRIVEVLNNYGSDFCNSVWICHPDFQLLCHWRKEYPHLQLVHSTRLAKISEGPERHCANLAERGISVLNMHHTDWNGGLVALAHRFNLAAFSWDLQYPEQLSTAYRMGIDAVFSDWTDRMVDVFNEEFG